MSEEKDETITTLIVKKELLNEFDEAIKGKYSTRSEALRELMRNFIEKKNGGT